MEYRPLGQTGVQVSAFCLGAMMFGPWGNDDRADAIDREAIVKEQRNPPADPPAATRPEPMAFSDAGD